MDLQLFQKHLRVARQDDKGILAHCPFTDAHVGGDDSTPSFRVDASGRWRCYGCGASGSAAEFKRKMERPVVPSTEVQNAHNELLSAPEAMEYLREYKLLLRSTVTKYRLGFEPVDGWIWIPIRDEHGVTVNVRKFDYTREKSAKYVHYDEGFAHDFCWPCLDQKAEYVVICEGEFKALVLLQAGIPAQTLPSGVRSFSRAMLPDYKGKSVYILFDADEPGRSAARRVAAQLEYHATAVYVVDTPQVEARDKHKATDVIDYLRACGALTAEKQRELLDELLLEAQRFDDIGNFVAVTLSDSTNADYTGKRIATQVRVVGKDLAPYTVPRVARIECTPDDGPRSKCALCPVAGGEATIVLDHSNPNRLLSLAGVPTVQLTGLLRSIAGVPKGCQHCHVCIDEYQNLEEVTITPSVRNLHRFGSHVLRQAWYLGPGLQTNAEYGFYGISTPSPKDQHATQLVLKADPAQSDLDSWTNTRHEELRAFQGFDYTAYVKDLEANVVRDLRGIRDMVEAMDYVYHSVLSFDFDGYRIHKGWAEALVLGDPRVGKTRLAEALAQHYQAGEVLSGEQCTMAGLLGSLQKIAGRWILVWGKLPQLDRRLGFVDETSGLAPETIGLLSGVRSSGIAQLVKVCEEKTAARARLLWLSNCRRSGAQLSDYTFGVEAVQEIYGQAEDVARLDFAFTISREDLPEGVIYSERPVCQHVYTTDLCSALIMWVWTRKPEHVRFTPAATKRCLSLARAMGSEYSSTIPLVKAAEQRNTMAKLAVAAAARRYSSPDGELLVVLEEHVEMANDFLERCWKRTSLGYDAYSQAQRRVGMDRDVVRTKILELPNPSFFLEWALGAPNISVHDLAIFDMDRQMGGEFISRLAENRCLVKGRGGSYTKTATFIAYLKELSEDKKFAEQASTKTTLY